MAKREDVSSSVDHLIVALLSVGGYPLQRTWDRLERLREEGLTNTEVAGVLDEGEVVRRLARAGYDRGPDVTTSMAKRLLALHSQVKGGVLDQAKGLIARGDVDGAGRLLRRIKGVGPMVFQNFLALEQPERGNRSQTASR